MGTKTLWETDSTDLEGYAPMLCRCKKPIINDIFYVKNRRGKLTKNLKMKLPHYKCGRCLSWYKGGK